MDQIQAQLAAQLTTYQKLLNQVIQIQSVRGTATAQAPYGPGPKAAVTQALAIAASFGLQTHLIADRVGYAELSGEDADYIGVLGHLDVVAAGDDWHSAPFALTVAGDKMFARGVLDNKGPIMGALFALALLKQNRVPLKHSIRVMFGTDEESGSSDIPYYLAQQPAPIAGFTPDGKYPVVYAERGLVGLSLTTTLPQAALAQLTALSGDFGAAYIPDHAQMQLNGRTYRYTGVRAPSNAPDTGDNVIGQLAADLAQASGELGEYGRWLAGVMADTDGTHLGVAYHDAISGALQQSVYAITKVAHGLQLDLSMRYPVTMTQEMLLADLHQHLPAHTQVEVKREVPRLYRDPDQPEIQIMSQVYGEVTGLANHPVSTTGITYARAMPNIVAFGPSFPGQRGIAHKGDEWLKISDWLTMMTIDYHAMARLANEI
ncbi:Sapep family Mn(2+)-dependent dipeptidase [Lacticaseibacillus jixiensis]|uniref:Sapep family Mn(2+)-dependent dipeptidase n=1 Tax=Lacticaseibacillus jixiensis TaxID=3231926 RepID=UPI0036F375D7